MTVLALVFPQHVLAELLVIIFLQLHNKSCVEPEPALRLEVQTGKPLPKPASLSTFYTTVLSFHLVSMFYNLSLHQTP